MIHSRFFSLLHKTLTHKSPFPIPQSLSIFTHKYGTVSQDSNPSIVQSDNVSAIVDELTRLTLLEVMDLVEVMREKKGITELPLMMLMTPGMGIRVPPKGVGVGGGKIEEKKVEKTAFDVKLDAFDVASKIKVIKEVRTFTSLGLKEAKDLVEKVPTVLKKGVTKEEAESIIAKMNAVGAKVSME
ncbi:hypothetical protein Lal_00029528 [Lupinus albus]|uniref:Putative ribosomal protein L7/L12 n=1 Tax=Lupinus albus TaxID=3870 RepID=A0A6A5MSY4_LUPAL|nr:putative ribosomal protein L7/L12 [Lupinus albus]KAF1873822.1 hypothetical protein Lal_00029528 [Lupinus albus]